MKTPLAAVTLVSLSLAVGSAFAAQKRPDKTEVLINADARSDNSEDLRPAEGKPVYYILTNALLSLGEPVAGVKMPEPAAIERLVVSALASQGFVRTEVGGPVPSIWIIARWGEANLENPPRLQLATSTEVISSTDGLTATENRITPVLPANTWDRWQLEQLIGTYRAFSGAPWEMSRIRQVPYEDRLYISIMAVDPESWRQKQPRALWRTSMTVDGRNSLADVAPVMLASGAPYFGLDSRQPIFVGDPDRRDASVRTGNIIVVGDGGAAPEASPPKADK